METTPRPPIDPELAAPLALIPEMTARLTLDNLAAARGRMITPPLGDSLAEHGIVETIHRIPGHDGVPIDVSVFRKEGHSDATAPGIFHIHGGGMVLGSRYDGAAGLLPWIDEYDAVAVSVEYRLAPEHPDPTPVEDCYAAFRWFADNATDLGFDPDRILVMGGSAGGGLAAGTTLLARDRPGPKVAWQLLICPMLDDRDETVSTRQVTEGVWDRDSNRTGWTALLGDRRATDDVSIYAAPARADDLSGLPPTFIDTGDSEVFRDEAVAYASKIWAAGSNAELHVWAGGFHGFAAIPTAAVSVEAIAAINNWVRRQFSRLPR